MARETECSEEKRQDAYQRERMRDTRNDREMVRLLHRHGACRDRVDRHGKNAAERPGNECDS